MKPAEHNYNIGDSIVYKFGSELIETKITKKRKDGMVKLLNHLGWYNPDILKKTNEK